MTGAIGHLATRFVALLLLLAWLAACSSIQIGAPYDKSIDDDLVAFQKAATEFIVTMRQEAATPKGAYGSDLARKYYASAEATLSNLQIRADLLSDQPCPIASQLSGLVATPANATVAGAEAEAGIAAPDLPAASGNCVSIVVAYVHFAEGQLEADHRENGKLGAFVAQLNARNIDDAVRVALKTVRAKKY